MSSSSKLFGISLGAVTAASLTYGGYLGMRAPSPNPSSLADARDKADPAKAFGKGVLDFAISGVDDAALLLLNPILGKAIPGYSKGIGRYVNFGMVAGGGALAGGLIAKEYNQWYTAKKYVERANRSSTGSSLISDNRVAPISGFNNQGPVGALRLQKTGIGSPSSQGIGYRMDQLNPFSESGGVFENNPLAGFVNSSLTKPANSPEKESDPRARALSYGFVGGLIGTALMARRGIGAATIGGTIGGIAAGLYGINQAHSTDIGANLEALGNVAEAAMPAILAGSALFGLTRLRGNPNSAMGKVLNKIGTGSTKFIKDSSFNIAESGARLSAFTESAHGKAIMAAHRLGTNARIPLKAALSFKTGVMGGDFAKDEELLKSMGRTYYSATYGTLKSASFAIRNGIAPMLEHSAPMGKSVWEQSMGVGHVTTWLPHQILMAAAAGHIVKDNMPQEMSRKKKSHATGTMPSNRAR